MITPILKDPKSHGGTLYTFPSASRDLTRAFTNSEYEFAFSHFACLNLPDFRYGDFDNGDLKGIYLDNLCKHYYSNVDSDLFEDSDSDSLSDLLHNNLNTSLKWHMQSYVMNYEVAILNGFSLNDGVYDNEILLTPSERIFFNWLQKVGAIKFSGKYESLEGYGDGVKDIEYKTNIFNEADLPTTNDGNIYKIGNKLYTWRGGEWKSRVLISKTVQYIGTIDMINNVNIDCDSFNEIYLNIPSGVGGSNVVFYNNSFDTNNYVKGNIIDVRNDLYCDSDDKNREYIIGRNLNNLDLNDITLKAIYDSKYEHGSGYESPTYKIDSGYRIDFNDSTYGDSIESMNLESKEDFEFNCVLIYYRIKKGDGDWFTNLYGVLFLEEVTTSDFNTNLNNDNEIGGYIQRYPKFKNGNSWGLKLDLKIDAQPDSQMELRDNEYSDPNSGGDGMQMFTEALMQLNDCVKIFYEVKKENTDIEERLYKLENIMSGVDSVNDLRNSVNLLSSNVSILNSFEGRIESLESKLAKIETNLGYLISDIKSLTSNINPRLSILENSIKDVIVIENKVNNIKILEDKVNGLYDLIENDIEPDNN
jgi:hypothetical protein